LVNIFVSYLFDRLTLSSAQEIGEGSVLFQDLATDRAARVSAWRQAGGEAAEWKIIAKMARMGASDFPRPLEPNGMMLQIGADHAAASNF